jgi:hypothetical protein
MMARTRRDTTPLTVAGSHADRALLRADDLPAAETVNVTASAFIF